MPTLAEWISGARPRTLPNAIAPVLIGSGAAAGINAFSWWQSTLCLIVALSMVVGVNFANDYSDGIRGVDAQRVGPQRLVGSGIADPLAVRNAALICFGVAALIGTGVVISAGAWWLLLLGALCIAAAWFYTGGPKPYGYLALGELAVFIFFGPVAVLGTLYLQAGYVYGSAWGSAIALGLFSCAVLVANNLRDIPSDKESGKRTLAVLLGDQDTRSLYTALVTVPFLFTTLMSFRQPLVLLGFLALPLIFVALRQVLRGVGGLALVSVLRDTAIAMLVWAIGTAIGLAF